MIFTLTLAPPHLNFTDASTCIYKPGPGPEGKGAQDFTYCQVWLKLNQEEPLTSDSETSQSSYL